MELEYRLKICGTFWKDYTMFRTATNTGSVCCLTSRDNFYIFVETFC